MLSKLCAEQGIPASNPERERAGLERTCHQSLNLWSFEQSDPESYWVVRRSRLRVCGSLNHWKYLPLRLLGKLQFLFRIMWRAWKLPNSDWREYLWFDSSSSAAIEESFAFLTATIETCLLALLTIWQVLYAASRVTASRPEQERPLFALHLHTHNKMSPG